MTYIQDGQYDKTTKPLWRISCKISRTIQHTNTGLEPTCCRGPVDSDNVNIGGALMCLETLQHDV